METSQLIETVLKGFDFKKVHAYMVLTNWKWFNGSESVVPSLEQIEDTANGILWNVIESAPSKKGDEGAMQGQGGFYAYRFKWGGKVCYKLTFEPFRASNF